MGRVANEKTTKSRVYRAIKDGEWHTAKEVSESLGRHDVANITATIRRLRQDGCRIDVRRRKGTGYSYRLVDEGVLKNKAEADFRVILDEAGAAPTGQKIMSVTLKYIAEGRATSTRHLATMALNHANKLRLLRLRTIAKAKKGNGVATK